MGGLWASRMSFKGVRKIDLHGFFVKQAMDICRNVIRSCVAGERVVFITGRGLNSQGGVPRIRNALIEMLDAMPSVGYRLDLGQVIVEKKK
jgi:DNA-nicking Smr family endonuclease